MNLLAEREYAKRLPRSKLEESVQHLDPTLDRSCPTFKAAVLLLCAGKAGLNVDKLSNVTGIPRTFVAQCVRRLVDGGVWSGEAGPPHPEPRGESSVFWRNVAVAEGKLCRRAGPHGEVEWAPPGSWVKDYDFISAAEREGLSNVYRDRPPRRTDVPALADGRRRPRRKRAIRRGAAWKVGRRVRSRGRAPARPSAGWQMSLAPALIGEQAAHLGFPHPQWIM